MHPIVYYILFFLFLGALGMLIANKTTTLTVRRQRWLKYFTYIVFTGAILTGIFFNFIFWLAWVIVVAAVIELFIVNSSVTRRQKITAVKTFLIFFPIAAGFILFSKFFNASFLLFIYFQVIVFDGFCQITGQLFGKHQLIRAISPSKTVEGLIGGGICCIIAALMAANWVHLSLYTAFLFGIVTSFTSFCGDLLASWNKRKKNIKDYSNWLPGQGGFLDRFDSLMMTGAVYYILQLVIFTHYFNFLTDTR